VTLIQSLSLTKASEQIYEVVEGPDHLKASLLTLLVLFGYVTANGPVVVSEEGETTTFVYTGDDNDGPNTDSLIHYNFAGFNRRTRRKSGICEEQFHFF